jgi:hypothetical protein
VLVLVDGRGWKLVLPDPPSSPFPESTSLQDDFYSSAVLDNALEVSLCQDDLNSRVTGLLLHSAPPVKQGIVAKR